MLWRVFFAGITVSVLRFLAPFAEKSAATTGRFTSGTRRSQQEWEATENVDLPLLSVR